MKQIRRLTREEVSEIGSLILEGNLEKLQSVRDQPEASVLKVWFASVAVKAISKGDAHALTIILDRIVGKVKDTIELTGRDGGAIESVSVNETQVKAAIAKIESEF